MPLGRILLRAVSDSHKLSLLKTDTARLLYSWLIPHVDYNGNFSGDPEFVRGHIFKRLRKTEQEVEDCLADLEDKKLIIRYEADGDKFLHVVKFVEKQPHLNPEREAETTIPLPPGKKRPTKTESRPSLRVYFDEQGKTWVNITEEDKKRWGEAYPACDIEIELKKMIEWILSNPEKAKKTRWLRFITSWLSREQNRGGTKASPVKFDPKKYDWLKSDSDEDEKK